MFTSIEYIAISVDQVMDYRELTTVLPLLNKFPIEIDQLATITASEQFVRLVKTSFLDFRSKSSLSKHQYI
ncbi:MAG: hypothetical protein IGS23_07215 [Rivularia sp. T60_A2020_040]|nr:hypothetical protein [Rivularia sp. T60_A2020_040]